MQNAIKEKSFKYAVRVVVIFKTLTEDRKEFILSKQLLKSGTFIGANVREAQNAESRADFIHKLGIAQKEADETLYWLELLRESEYINGEEFKLLHGDRTEILKIIRTIIINTKKNNS